MVQDCPGVKSACALRGRPFGVGVPSPRGLQLKDFDFSRLFKALGIAAAPHGFRSSFRDWAAECTDVPHAVMEAALAHVVGNKAEAGLHPLGPVRAPAWS